MQSFSTLPYPSLLWVRPQFVVKHKAHYVLRICESEQGASKAAASPKGSCTGKKTFIDRNATCSCDAAVENTQYCVDGASESICAITGVEEGDNLSSGLLYDRGTRISVVGEHGSVGSFNLD